MSLSAALIGYGLKQALATAGGTVVGETADSLSAQLLDWVRRRFSDSSQALPQALARANDRAWQALGIALAGDGLLDQIRVFFARGDEKGLREQVRRFLAASAVPFAWTDESMRRACLEEWKQARKAGLLSVQKLTADEVAQQVAGFQRFADPTGLTEGAWDAAGRVADDLAPRCPHLAALLRQRPAGGTPLLVAAFAYFFRREVATNQELANELVLDSLRQLCAGQENAFEEVRTALDILSERFDLVMEQLGHIEAVTRETHSAVLDMQAELQRLGHLNLGNVDEIRGLFQQVTLLLGRVGMQTGEVRAHHSFSIRGNDERRLVKQMLTHFRRLPVEQQREVPALFNGLGKLQLGTGEFAEAHQTFIEVAAIAPDAAAQAESWHNAYRAALEEKGRWPEALDAIRQAARLDPQRFEPFPLRRYVPQRILGAGGFGSAFLCHDQNFDAEVVVKALHAADLERSIKEVFREAVLLRQLSHPYVIGARDCDYADPRTPARPYIVMDYFPGSSLEEHLREHGVLSPPDLQAVAGQIALGVQAAHRQGILHRDLKPANVLIRKEGTRWQVKIIDFGLALKHQTIETSAARGTADNTVLGCSITGTIRYAPPEQMGELKDGQGKPVPLGEYSDVYAFGKLCCYALFRTTEPKRRQWASLHGELADVLERCTEQELEHRHADFEPVVDVLQRLLPDKAAAIAGQAVPVQKLPQPGEAPTNSLGMRFAWIPPGTFLMGSPTTEGSPPSDRDIWLSERSFLLDFPRTEGSRSDDETQHRITLTGGFYLGIHQVTQAQWQAIMGNNPSHFKGDDRPVEQVSWDDCQEFCRKLGEREGKHYRLPTEAEWEYACRAGTTTPFHFGQTISTDLANYDGNHIYGRGKTGPYRQETTAVGSFPPNAWGLYDMHGNVWEWCADWYGLYPKEDMEDYQGSPIGECRVLRGGSWNDGPGYCRAACRLWYVPSSRDSTVGCRVCLCLD